MADEEEVVQEEAQEQGQPEQAAAPEAVDGQEQAQEQAPPPINLPENFASKYGVKSLDEWEKKYTSSSQEAHRLAEERKRDAAMIEGYRELLVRAQQQQPQQKAAPSPENDFFGFGSMEALQAGMQRDYAGTVKRMLAHEIRNNTDVLKEAVQPIMQQYMAPVQEREMAARRQAQAQEFFSKYPEAKEGPLNDSAGRWVNDQSNRAVVDALSQVPDLNLTGAVYKLANFDIQRQELEALRAKMGQARSKADTVRPGTGGRAQVKVSNPKSSIHAAAEDLRASGMGDVPQEWVEAAAQSVQQYLGSNYRK